MDNVTPSIIPRLESDEFSKDILPQVAVHQSTSKELSKARFEIKRVIGSTSTGTVSEAFDRRESINVILKKIPLKSIACHEKQLGRMMSMLHTLDHPNINRMRSYYITGNHLYIVLDHSEHTALVPASRQGRVNCQSVFLKFWQIVSAVDYCHRLSIHGLIITPENILVNGKGDAVLADVGLSVLFGHANTLHSSSPHYIAPEVHRSQGEYDGRTSDAYSLGILLYSLFTQKPTFTGFSSSEYMMLLKGKDGGFDLERLENLKDCIARLTRYTVGDRMTVSELKRHPFWRGCCRDFNLSPSGATKGGTSDELSSVYSFGQRKSISSDGFVSRPQATANHHAKCTSSSKRTEDRTSRWTCFKSFWRRSRVPKSQ